MAKPKQIYRKNLLLLLVCFLFCSCDIFYFAQIVNKSGKDIKVEIWYDKEALDNLPGKKPVIPYFDEATLVSFDTLNRIGKFKILPNDSLEIDSQRGNRPRFQFIKKIEVFGIDTIKLKDIDQMKALFKEGKGRFFSFDVK